MDKNTINDLTSELLGYLRNYKCINYKQENSILKIIEKLNKNKFNSESELVKEWKEIFLKRKEDLQEFFSKIEKNLDKKEKEEDIEDIEF